MLEIKHFTKRFGDKIAVKDLSLTIHPGEIYGFIGHNGAGKTTTIKACCGILPYEEGEITVDGLSVRDNPLICKQRLAYIPDNPELYDFLTGMQYLNFIGDIYQIPASEQVQRIGQLAAALEITDDLIQPISGYSHGMKQKVAIIAAWMHNPSLLLMDEPFVGLDPKASHTLKQMMRTLCDNGGAIFFSTHVLEVVEKLCDRVAIIRRGELVASGSVDEVKGNDSLEDIFLELEADHVQ